MSLGCTLAGGIVAFGAGGFALDRWLGLTPLFTVIGTLAGAVLGFLHVYWRIQAETRKDGERR